MRTQRVQLWLATSFLGFAVFSFTVGLTSREASAMLADTRPWLLLSVLPSVVLPYTLLRVERELSGLGDPTPAQPIEQQETRRIQRPADAPAVRGVQALP